jgi:hypothetical protein
MLSIHRATWRARREQTAELPGRVWNVARQRRRPMRRIWPSEGAPISGNMRPIPCDAGPVRPGRTSRERLRPDAIAQVRLYIEAGMPPLRPLFLEFPDDPEAWEIEDQHLFGPSLLVAPVLEYQARTRSVYLPAGARWTDVWTGRVYEGGQRVEVDAPLERIPVFTRDAAALPVVA